MGTCVKRTAAQCQIPIFPECETHCFGSRHCAAVLFAQVPEKCTELDLSLLYTVLIFGTYNKFARENDFRCLFLRVADMRLERWPQVCLVRIMFTLLPTNYFVSTTMNSKKCLVNRIPLKIRVRLRNKLLDPTSICCVCVTVALFC